MAKEKLKAKRPKKARLKMKKVAKARQMAKAKKTKPGKAVKKKAMKKTARPLKKKSKAKVKVKARKLKPKMKFKLKLRKKTKTKLKIKKKLELKKKFKLKLKAKVRKKIKKKFKKSKAKLKIMKRPKKLKPNKKFRLKLRGKTKSKFKIKKKFKKLKPKIKFKLKLKKLARKARPKKAKKAALELIKFFAEIKKLKRPGKKLFGAAKKLKAAKKKFKVKAKPKKAARKIKAKLRKAAVKAKATPRPKKVEKEVKAVMKELKQVLLPRQPVVEMLGMPEKQMELPKAVAELPKEIAEPRKEIAGIPKETVVPQKGVAVPRKEAVVPKTFAQPQREKKLLEAFNREKEEDIKKFWEEKGIPEKVRKQNYNSGKKFYFMDGPPYATGHIHMGTALNKILKDVAIRSQRMQGKKVFDRAGYDTHGVPIEHAIEKELGFKNKKDIEAFGVKAFVGKCKDFATRFIGTMNSEFNDLGVWMDWDNPYMTLKNEYLEAIWHSFKEADKKGLLYLDKYSVHVCPRCETAVAYNEIEYGKSTDLSVYVKMPVVGQGNKFLLIWTTTPWSLPGNTGILAHPDFDYVEAKLSNGEIWILAKERLENLMTATAEGKAGYTIEKEFKGKELEGIKYENPLSKNLNLGQLENAYRVVMSERYVNLEDGTGLVHCAPGHGREDYEEGKKNGLPVLVPVNMDGTMKEEAGKYKGGIARKVDKEIVADLEQSGHLVYKHNYTHDYPFCWRCKTALLMLAVPQWFFKVSEIRQRMIELNKEVNWVPNWMKDRMANWLESLGDWPISRQRYWGSPLPIWLCECGNKKVIGSLAELAAEGVNVEGLELHKPEIDEVKLKCSCGKEMKRVPEVLDVWFDSGVSSWAALGYPSQKELFEEFWPADLNLEGTDQVRGWWNSEMITSVICFDKLPFKSVAVHGMVLDMGKNKMSKSLGNIVKPAEVIEKYSRDYLRYYLVTESKGVDIAFDIDGFREVNKFFTILWNCYNFGNLYLNLDFENLELESVRNGLQTEDLWLLSKFNSLVKNVSENYNKYEFFRAIANVDYFVTEELSRTYIKLVRDRVGTDSQAALEKILNNVLFGLLRLLSPITPHIAEYIYQNLKGSSMEESIHLFRLPEADGKLIDEGLEKQMQLCKELAQAALSIRDENKLRLRWTLNELVVKTKSGNEIPQVKEILAEMCNVKKVGETAEEPSGNYAAKEVGETKLFLNLEADKELKDGWELSELTRRIQDARKQAKLNPNDRVELFINCSDKEFLEKFKSAIEEATNTVAIVKEGPLEKLLEREFYIEVAK